MGNKNKSKKYQEIFLRSFVSGSVKTQKELDAAFLKYPNLSRAYVQTALYWENTRKWYEEYWPRVYKYLDNDFLDRFRMEGEHRSRAWEFHIAAVFVERGLQLEEKTWKYGPDFCLKTSDGKRIWIEAVTCNLGEADPVEPYPDMISGKIYSFGGNIEDIHRPRALRITSVIGTKFEKFKEYLNNSPKSGVAKEDCLFVAVNGSAIQHLANPDMLFKRAIFGQGPNVYFKIPGRKKLKGPFYKPILTITKKVKSGDSSIPANFMEMDEFSKISAILYCGHTASHSWCNGYEVGDDFLFAYHTNPDNPIPEDLFKFGRGIRKDVNSSTIIELDQKKMHE